MAWPHKPVSWACALQPSGPRPRPPVRGARLCLLSSSALPTVLWFSCFFTRGTVAGGCHAHRVPTAPGPQMSFVASVASPASSPTLRGTRVRRAFSMVGPVQPLQPHPCSSPAWPGRAVSGTAEGQGSGYSRVCVCALARMHVCMCVRVFVWELKACVCACMCVCERGCICPWVCMRVYVSICIHRCACGCVCAHVCVCGVWARPSQE